MIRAAQEFWQLTNDLRAAAAEDAHRRFAHLGSAPPATLFAFLGHYRLFTQRYISDLALLVSRMPEGAFRSALGDILAEELGHGSYEQDHLRLYDRFLATCGAPPVGNLPSALLDELRDAVLLRSVPYAIGLRGMGGECMCALYLEALHAACIDNPQIAARKGSIDWTFWDVHLGEVEGDHDRLLRACVTAMLEASPESGPEVAAGFRHGTESWLRFWDTVPEAITASGSA